MELSLSSTLSSSKPFLSQSLPANRRQRLPVLSVSCRTAATFATNGTNFYKVLSLSPKKVVGADEIKRAYRRQALRYHPDVCPPSMKDESTKMFVQLNEAYKVLSDPVSKREYDSELGLSISASFRSNNIRNDNDRFGRESKVWQHQVSELKTRTKSKCRMGMRKDGSWGSRMRAQNRKREI